MGGTKEIFITVTHYHKSYPVSLSLKVGLSELGATKWV
jgi:hypothetical protein